MDSYMKRHKKRIPKNADLDWWIAYMLDASRETKMQIIEYKPYLLKGGQAKVGNLQGVLLVFKMVGRFDDVLRFVGSLENRPEVMRIARVVLLPGAPVAVNISFAVLTSKSKARAAVAAAEKGDASKSVLPAEDEKEAPPAANGVAKGPAAAVPVPAGSLLPPAPGNSEGKPPVQPAGNGSAAGEKKTEE